MLYSYSENNNIARDIFVVDNNTSLIYIYKHEM